MVAVDVGDPQMVVKNGQEWLLWLTMGETRLIIDVR